MPVLERARKLVRLEKAVRELLPAELAAHCKVLNLKNETLVLATSSPAWTSRLRFASAELIRQLRRRHGLEVTRTALRTLPQVTENQKLNPRPQTLSGDSASLLAQTAATVDHPPLQEALMRLAAKTREV